MRHEDAVRNRLNAIIAAKDLTQRLVGERLGLKGANAQVWMSRRVGDGERNELTINDVAAIADALEQDLEVVFTPRGSDPLTTLVAALSPDDAELARQVIGALPGLSDEARRLIRMLTAKSN